MNISKRRLLLFSDWFYPGYKAGGPIKSTTNICLALANQFDIYVFTGDRDLNETVTYSGVAPNKWTNPLSNGVQVYYCSPDHLSSKRIYGIIKEVQPACIYLNHVYSLDYVIKPLIIWRYFFSSSSQLVLCPRGGLFESALHYKNSFFKKKLLISFIKLLRWHKRILFHATTTAEKKAVQINFGNVDVLVAGNLPSMVQQPLELIPKDQGKVSLIFVARIVALKNLHLLLGVLSEIAFEVQLTIVGPVEDAVYWEDCKNIIGGLPPNIRVTYLGSQDSATIARITLEHHLFCLPSKGENFGHSIFEAFLLGRPVLISDQTPWLNLAEKNVGWDLPLDDAEGFGHVIEIAANWNQATFDAWAAGAYGYATSFIKSGDHIDPYLQLFQRRIIDSTMIGNSSSFSLKWYIIKFLCFFFLFYYGTEAIIAFAVPGGYYSYFVQHYLDYTAVLRASLLKGPQLLLSVFGYRSTIEGLYHLRMENGSAVQLVYSCLGYGLMSFWAAFVIANYGSVKKKATWIFAGFLFLWMINVTRIALLLIAINKHWPIPFGLDHHTLFNIAAYLLIFTMIYFFDRSQRGEGNSIQQQGAS